MHMNDAVFVALADPTRRRLLERLATGPRSATGLAARFPLTRQAVVKHLGALADAGMVAKQRQGREVRYRLDTQPLTSAMAWMNAVGSARTRLVSVSSSELELRSGNVSPVTGSVTGATGGIGQAIAEALAARGAHLVLTGRRTDVLEPLAERLKGRTITADLAERDGLGKLFEQAGDPDVVVENGELVRPLGLPRVQRLGGDARRV